MRRVFFFLGVGVLSEHCGPKRTSFSCGNHALPFFVSSSVGTFFSFEIASFFKLPVCYYNVLLSISQLKDCFFDCFLQYVILDICILTLSEGSNFVRITLNFSMGFYGYPQPETR